MAASILHRLDEKDQLFLNNQNSKRIIVKDTGEPPYFLVEPKLDWYVGVGEALDIPFSDYVDPENATVFFKIRLRNANKFAFFDYETNKIVIEKRSTTKFDSGEYPIKVMLTEYVNGLYMSPQGLDLILTVGDPIPPEPLPPLKVPPTGVPPPKAKLKEFLMNGKMKLTFSTPLEFPADL